jgi:hypothetical protein
MLATFRNRGFIIQEKPGDDVVLVRKELVNGA